MTVTRVPAYLAHETSGRMRICAPVLRGEAAAGEQLARGLGATGAFTHVEVRSRTGSIVVSFTGARSAALTALHGLIDIERAPRPAKTATPPILRAEAMIRTLDQTVSQASEGRLDLRNAAFVLFCLAALVQLGRGVAIGPASALAWSAFSLAARAQPFEED